MKTQWKLLTDEKARQIWNENLARFEDCSPFQTFEWGQFHVPLGWKPLYFANFDEKENVTALALGLLKRFPFKTGFIWCTGGPIGEITTWDESLTNTIKTATNLKRLYVRFRCDRDRKTRDVLFLEHNDWKKPYFSMGSSFSMEIDLGENSGDVFSKLSRNWKRNLRSAEKNNLVIKRIINPDIEEIRKAFAEMEKHKKLPELFSLGKLESLFKNARSNFICFRCEDKEGNLLAIRGALISGKRACDYIAVSTLQGKKMRASFAVLWEIFSYCRENGIALYDLGGIDPWKNPGVYSFKRGTGAREVEQLGEWDWATSSFLRWFGNWAIKKRQTSKGKDSESNKSTKPFGKIYGSATRLVRNVAGSVLGILKVR